MCAIFAPDRAIASVFLLFTRHRPLIDASVFIASGLTILAIFDGHGIAASVRASSAASLVTGRERPNQPAVVRFGAFGLERIIHKRVRDIVILLQTLAIEIALDGTGLVAVEVFGRRIRADVRATIAGVDMVSRFAHSRGTRIHDVAVAETRHRGMLTHVAFGDVFGVRVHRRNAVAVEVAGLAGCLAIAGNALPLNASL